VIERHPQDDLPGLLTGELSPATAAVVDHHLAGCDPCRRDPAAVASASSALRDAARLPFTEAAGVPPPPALDRPAAAPTAPVTGLPSSVLRDRSRRSRWLLGAAAVLVALALEIGGLTFGRDRGPGRAQTLALAAPAASSATASAHMHGAGDAQIMTMTARGLPRPPAGGFYEVWLVGDGGGEFPVGILAPDGQGIWSLPAEVAARYRTIDVTLEPADGDPSRSPRTVLRGSYA
jgi:anti-sigma factor RsiW